MIKYFSKAFKITNENIILTTPIVTFFLVFLAYMGVSQNPPKTPVTAILFIFTTLFMLVAFFAGWFFMIKKAVDLDKKEFESEEEKAKASFFLIKEFPTGVGKYFLSFLGAVILYVGLFLLLFFLVNKAGLHFIGKLNVGPVQLKLALTSYDGMKALLSSLAPEQLIRLNKWYFLILSTMLFYSFLTLFWPAQIVSKTKNPLFALFKSIRFLFNNFLTATILFVYINILNLVVSFLVNVMVLIPSQAALLSLALYLLAMLIHFYFVVYIVVLIFLYYDSESNRVIKVENAESFEQSEESYSDGSSDSSNSGTDGIGEEQSGDSDSQGN